MYVCLKFLVLQWQQAEELMIDLNKIQKAVVSNQRLPTFADVFHKFGESQHGADQLIFHLSLAIS